MDWEPTWVFVHIFVSPLLKKYEMEPNSTWFSLSCSRSVIKYQIFSRIQMLFLKKFKLFFFIPFPQIQYMENHLFFESWNSLKMDSKSHKKIHHSTEGGGRWVNFFRTVLHFLWGRRWFLGGIGVSERIFRVRWWSKM